MSELSHTHDAIDLLESLVSIPSLSGQESGASTHLVEWMTARGFDARVDEVGNAVGARGDGPRQVMLLGHIDTFPGDLPVRREGDWLHGRGTVDAKGPLCAFVVAASGIDVPDGWQVAVVGAVEEEAASSRGARHILENWPTPQACLIGEPSNWDRITLGYKGRLLADVRLRVPFVHSAGQARLPAEQAVDLWNAIVAYCDEFNAGRQKAFDRLDPSLRHIATRDEGAYGGVEMSIGFRLPLDLLPDDLAQSISHIPGLSARTGKHQTSNVEWTFSGGEVAYRTKKNTPLVRAFLSAIRKQGAKPRFVLKTGTCDMNVVGPVWDCPIVAYGPGDSSLDHTPDERINLNEYLQSIEILKSVLSQSMGVEHDAR